jgi:hypothetical protein
VVATVSAFRGAIHMKSAIKLYIRVRLPDGSYPYLKPAYASNGRLRPHHAIQNGRAVHFPGSTYYLRFHLGGRRVWESAGVDPTLAVINLQKKHLALREAALGIEPAPPPALAQPATPIPISNNKRLLTDCVDTYIAEIKEHKSKKTLAAYRLTVDAFCEVVKRTYVEDITREDILLYAAALRKKGSSPRTIRNRRAIAREHDAQLREICQDSSRALQEIRQWTGN